MSHCQISEADLEVSRQRISVFLSTHLAYELLSESGKVIALDVDLPVKQAFHILYEQLGNHGSNLTEEELETHTISAWKEAKLYLLKQSTEHGKIFSKRLVQAGPDENLKDITLKILQNRVATLPITHSTSDDGSYPQLLYLASLSEVLKLVCRYFRHSASSLPILQLPICSLFAMGSQDHSGRIDDERNGESMLWPEVAGKGRYFELDPDTRRVCNDRLLV
ncbi:hypothetical protein Tco_1293590, partial [Tanacetum coccineum]